jgi:predicted nucleic acid-binding protein
MEKKSVYIETTIPSYATAKASRDVIKTARQTITQLFWETARENYHLYISQYVIDECSKGDINAAQRRLELIKDIDFLKVSQNTERLALTYQTLLCIPEDAKVDSFHLAVCVESNINYLLSWNYTHLGIESYGKLFRYNEMHGLPTPLLITPEALNTKDNI